MSDELKSSKSGFSKKHKNLRKNIQECKIMEKGKKKIILPQCIFIKGKDRRRYKPGDSYPEEDLSRAQLAMIKNKANQAESIKKSKDDEIIDIPKEEMKNNEGTISERLNEDDTGK